MPDTPCFWRFKILKDGRSLICSPLWQAALAGNDFKAIACMHTRDLFCANKRSLVCTQETRFLCAHRRSSCAHTRDHLRARQRSLMCPRDISSGHTRYLFCAHHGLRRRLSHTRMACLRKSKGDEFLVVKNVFTDKVSPDPPNHPSTDPVMNS